jgi:hypothetical protein
VDADFVNDPASGKSTSGSFFQIVGTRTSLPLDFQAKSQEATARSTPEAELYVLDHGVHVMGIPLSLQWSMISGQPFALEVMEDNSTVISAMERGFSRKMAYLPAKKERTSISGLHEFFHGDPDFPDSESPNHLLKESSEAMTADVFTKPLEKEGHWTCCDAIGLRPLGSKL